MTKKEKKKGHNHHFQGGIWVLEEAREFQGEVLELRAKRCPLSWDELGIKILCQRNGF